MSIPDLPPLPVEILATRTIVPPMSPAARDAAITGVVTDMLRVSDYACSHPDIPNTATVRALREAFAASEFPHLRVLARVTAYVLFQLQYDARRRPLRATELEVQASARRLSNACNGPREWNH